MKSVVIFLTALLLAHAALPQDVPNDEQLRQQQTRIGRIDIEVDDIFEKEIRTRVYHWVNDLHVTTRVKTIAEQLLFRSGDVYDRRVLDETERLLRSQRYLNAASIEPIAYNPDNTVDVVVRVHDVWTLSPGISFGRKGGANSSRVEIEDTNFLGLGKHVSLNRSGDADRTAWQIAYTDPNLFGTHWRMSTARSELSDGDETRLSFARPFYSLDDRWSAYVEGADSQSIGARYSLGAINDAFVVQRKAFELNGGWSLGVIENRVTRLLAGYRYQHKRFIENEQTTLLPDDSVLSYPWVGIERIEDEFLKGRNFDQIGRVEDINLGRIAHLEMGFNTQAIGATRDSVVINGLLQSGFTFEGAESETADSLRLSSGAQHYAIGSVSFNGRVEDGQLHNALVTGAVRYYRRHSSQRVTFASVQGTRAFHLDGDEQLLLGGDNGLRGYPLRYQAGTANLLAVAEERFYTNWQPLKLVNVGAAIFCDVGRAWGQDPTAAAPQGWLGDIGIGLRLGNARSALGNVLHIDLALPLKGAGSDAHINRVQLLIETRRSF